MRGHILRLRVTAVKADLAHSKCRDLWLHHPVVGDEWADTPHAVHRTQAGKTNLGPEKPEGPMPREIKASANHEDIVADVFCVRHGTNILTPAPPPSLERGRRG